MQRRIASIVAVAAAASAFTCTGFDNIEVEVTGSTVIPRRSIVDDLLGNLAFVGFESFDISQSQSFRNQGYTKDDIDSVVLARFALTIRTPDGANFDFLERISFSAETDGLPPVEIARIDPVPRGATTLELEIVPDVELAPYAIAPTMTITTTATGQRPPEETTVDADVVLDIDVNVTGSCN